MLALSPEGHQDDPILERFLMLLVREGSGRGEDFLPDNPEERLFRCFYDELEGGGSGLSKRATDPEEVRRSGRRDGG